MPAVGGGAVGRWPAGGAEGAGRLLGGGDIGRVWLGRGWVAPAVFGPEGGAGGGGGGGGGTGGRGGRDDSVMRTSQQLGCARFLQQSQNAIRRS